MIVALALVGLLLVQALLFARVLQRQQRAHARREDLLTNQLLHLAGKPWQQAPAEHRERPVVKPDPFVLDPEQIL
jgi:hypothetical protein